jgi:hypothetical protein
MTESPPLICVAPQMIDKVWPMAEPLIRAGYEAVDEFVPDDIPGWLKAGRGLLWICVRGERMLAAMTTSLERPFVPDGGLWRKRYDLLARLRGSDRSVCARRRMC